MTDCVDHLDIVQEGGMARPDPEFVNVHYEVGADE